jgi:hypothetical protein
MRDWDIDYAVYTVRELEEALAGIDRRRYPKNDANLRAAYERLTSRTPPPPPAPEPVRELPAVSRPLPKYDEHGRYIPNQIDGMERVSYLAFSAVILAYGTYGVSTNDLYIPRRRHGIQLHDTPAGWFTAPSYAPAWSCCPSSSTTTTGGTTRKTTASLQKPSR